VSSVLESLAAFVQDPELGRQTEIRMDRLRLHFADTLAMILRGASLAEG
jgi:hypothetical protein